jgi:hypothetical protein
MEITNYLPNFTYLLAKLKNAKVPFSKRTKLINSALGTVFSVCQLKLDTWIFISKSLISKLLTHTVSIPCRCEERPWGIGGGTDGQTSSTIGSFCRLCKISTVILRRSEDEGRLVLLLEILLGLGNFVLYELREDYVLINDFEGDIQREKYGEVLIQNGIQDDEFGASINTT